MKTFVTKILMLATLIVVLSGAVSFLAGCKDMVARSSDGKPMVIYGNPPEPKEPVQPQDPAPSKQENKK